MCGFKRCETYSATAALTCKTCTYTCINLNVFFFTGWLFHSGWQSLKVLATKIRFTSTLAEKRSFCCFWASVKSVVFLYSSPIMYYCFWSRSQKKKPTFSLSKRTATNNWKMLPTDMLSAIKKKVKHSLTLY